MATGWDGIITGYNATIHFFTYRARIYNEVLSRGEQTFVDHARGMLQIIPAFRSDPFFENFSPPPFTSHDVLTFTTYGTRYWVSCEIPAFSYRIQFLDENEIMQNISVSVENLVEMVKQYIQKNIK